MCRLLTIGAWFLLQGPPSSGMSQSGSEAVKRPPSQFPGGAASSPAAERTRIKVVLNIGRVEAHKAKLIFWDLGGQVGERRGGEGRGGKGAV